MTPLAVCWLVSFALFVALAAWWNGRTRPRVVAIRVWCNAQGYEFRSQLSAMTRRQYAHLELPRWGADTASAVTGRYRDFRFVAFEYNEPMQPGHRRHDPVGSVVALLPERALQRLAIRPRGAVERRGRGNVRLELVAFNKAFRVDADEPRWAFEALGQRSIECLLESQRFHEILLLPGALVLRHRRFLPVDGIEAALELGHALLSQIPDQAGCTLR